MASGIVSIDMPLPARTGPPCVETKRQSYSVRPAFWLAMRSASAAGTTA
jgi:hypothetical protein